MRIFKLLSWSILVFSLSNCAAIEEKVYDQITTEEFYKNPTDGILAMGSAYSKLYGYASSTGIFPLSELCTDELAYPKRGDDWGSGNVWLRFQLHEWQPTDQSFNDSWNLCYSGIQECNRLIFTFENQIGKGNTFLKPLLAETKSLRALYYYWLLDLFGNVPIITNFNAPKNPANNTRLEVFNFVEQELKDNLDLLSKDNAATYGRINYFAAQAILAKLYLNAAVYTGNARWNDCLRACNTIIDSKAYQLENNYFDNFKTQNQNSAEQIFAIPYDKTYAKGFNLHLMTLHPLSKATYDFTSQPWNTYCALQEFYNSFDNEDLRKSSFLVGQQRSSTGVNLPINFSPEINAFDSAKTDAGARVGKFEFEKGIAGDLSNDFPLMRYSDVLLMKAECLWRLGGNSAEALALVSQVRARAGVASFTSLNAENLLAERGREMFAETWRRQDMIRFGQFFKSWKLANGGKYPVKPADANPTKTLLFPIPQEQIKANPNLRQNTGY